ncbi:hypothetical protein, partial [Salmonella sp. s51228]|uniref:hypothetical protein n=1 Tax=Salmonella sp. s51228 TaxID=3159652 RepID=UPI00397FE982
MHQPRDIAISGNFIVVLDSGATCVHVMLKTDEIVYTFGEKGPGLRLIDPWFIAASDEGLCFIS